MGKLVAIETYDRFVSLLESSNISERSLNFILDTGQLYTHGIFFNVVTFGTSTNLYVPLNIAGTTKNLSLAGHTHSNYYAKNNDIDIGNSKIVSGLSDIIKYVNASIEIGNSSNPTYFYGTLKTIKNNTEYTILDTSNFSIEEKTVSGIMLQNVTTFKYGNTNYLMDYVKRLNVINTLDNIATHTNMGTTNENSVPYGFLTMYTDGELINPKYALLRINITTGDILVRSSGNTTWRSLISSNSLPSIFGKSGSNASSGLVPSPGNVEGNTKFLCEDGTWKLPNYTTDTWREIKVNGTLKRSTSNSSGDLDFINGSNTTVEWTTENKLKINSTWIAWKGATSSAAGTAGYMPAPTSALREQFLRGDGSWVSLNNYTLPKSTTSALGGIIVSNVLTTAVTLTSANGTTANRYYGIQLDKDGKAFVNIPWVWNAFTAATANAAGTAGYIQAPAGAQNKFFRGDNTWQEIAQNVTSSIYFGASNGTTNAQVATTPYLIFKEGSSYTRYKLEGAGGITVSSDASGNLKFTGTTYSVFTGASSSAAGSTGLVKQPAAGDQGKFLRGDCTWQSLTSNVTTSLYVGASNGTSTAALSTNGSVYLILKEGSSYTRYNIVGSGRASVTSDANGKITINSSGYSNFTAATSSAAGSAGLVPAPGANVLGSSGYYLRADGSWAVPTNTWNAANSSQAGYVPKLTTGGGTIATQSTEYVLTFVSGGTGTITPTWKLLPANAFVNTWNLGSSSLAGYVPQATKNYFLHCNNSTGALEWVANPNTNTWRGIYVGGSSKVGTGTGTLPINFVAGSNVSITYEAAGTESGQSGNAGYFNVKISATDTKYSDFVKSGSNAAHGLVPKPSTTAGTTHYLREDGTWTVPPNDNTWKAANTSQEGYVPKLALASTNTIATQSTEYVLTYISGTETAPVWRKLPAKAFANTWTAWKGATDSANGTAGYMPAPTSAQRGQFLRGDGSWVSLNNYSLPTASNSTLGGVKTGAAITDTAGYTAVAIKDGVIYYKDTNTTYTFYNLLFQNSGGTTVDTYKPTTSPTKTLKAGSNVTISAASNVITIASTNTWTAMTGATSSADGTVGYVNAAPPKDGYNTKFLRADGTWNIPAYPTKSSWNYDDKYVSSLTTNGNSLRWVKNGSNNDITIPYATSAGSTPNLSSTTTKTYTGISYHAGSDGALNSTTARDWAIPQEATADYSYKNVQILRLGWTGNAYSTDILTSPNAHGTSTGLFYRLLVNGSYAAPTGSYHGGWRMILDSCNYATYCAKASHSHSYLPLSGGTLTGLLYFNQLGLGTTYIGHANASWMHFESPVPFYFSTSVAVNGDLYPYSNNSKSLGTSSNYWLNGYITCLQIGSGRYNAYDGGTYGINLNNSDIVEVNSILTSDLSESWKESIGFKRSNGNWDTFRAADGTFYFGVNNGTEYTAIHSGNIGSQSVNYATSAGSVAWGNVTGKPSTFTPASHTHSYLPLSGGTLSGNLTISHTTSATMTAASTNPKITFAESGGEQPVHLTYTDYDSYRSPAGLKVVGGNNASPAWFEAEGNMYAANFYTTSDRAKKQNISLFSEHIRKFQLKDTEKWHYGVVALEVEEMFRDGEEGNMTVNYNSVLSYYIGQLENRVKELENKIKQLEN